jgi:hypothetical protein
VVELIKVTKPKGEGLCWCGCGGMTKGRFVPGHDSRFHALAKSVARGEAEMPASFIHEDAKNDFMKWHDKEVEKLANEPKKDKKKAKKDVSGVAVDSATQTEVTDFVKTDIEPHDDLRDFELDPESDEYKELMKSVSMN